MEDIVQGGPAGDIAGDAFVLNDGALARAHAGAAASGEAHLGAVGQRVETDHGRGFLQFLEQFVMQPTANASPA